ncbi:MAG: ABC transporter permease subunit [Chloroflexota bacterium]
MRIIKGLGANTQMLSWSNTRKLIVSLSVFAILMIIVAALYAAVPAGEENGLAIDYPEKWDIKWELIKVIDKGVDWVIVTGDPVFAIINIAILRGILSPMEDYLLWLPWWVIIIIMGCLAWYTVGKKFAVVSMCFIGLMTVMGLLDLACQTLAIMLTSTLVCVALGLPLGILTALNNIVNIIMRPVLDAMQTMPIFVYLIPSVMLFGLGKVPAVIATCIYALPPIIRLTNLGIRQVDTQLVEAARSFGSTRWQILIKLQIPMALSTILAGLNQTVMMALGMVVVASMIGARGLGVEIFRAISRLEVGRGLIAGIGIVFLAMILDRISQGLARKSKPRAT